jgi:hypothetical protein
MNREMTLVSQLFRLVIIYLAIACPAFADVFPEPPDWKSAGGVIDQLQENQSIALRSEVVRLHISKHKIRAICEFVLHNDGPECSLRIGFPDVSSFQLASAKRLHSSFLSYHFSVDGKEVPSELVEHSGANSDKTILSSSYRLNNPNNVSGRQGGISMWHASTVSFPANDTRTIKVSYEQTPGADNVKDSPLTRTFIDMKTVRYILHSGAAWKGNIQQADIYVTFDRSEVRPPIKPRPFDKVWNKNAPKNELVYMTSATPTVEDIKSSHCKCENLHFKYENLEPTEKDDLILWYKPNSGWYRLYVLGRNAMHQH